MKNETPVFLVGILVQVIDPLRIEKGGAAFQTMDDVALLE